MDCNPPRNLHVTYPTPNKRPQRIMAIGEVERRLRLDMDRAETEERLRKMRETPCNGAADRLERRNALDRAQRILD